MNDQPIITPDDDDPRKPKADGPPSVVINGKELPAEMLSNHPQYLDGVAVFKCVECGALTAQECRYRVAVVNQQDAEGNTIRFLSGILPAIAKQPPVCSKCIAKAVRQQQLMTGGPLPPNFPANGRS